jgi:hypothetical protein
VKKRRCKKQIAILKRTTIFKVTKELVEINLSWSDNAVEDSLNIKAQGQIKLVHFVLRAISANVNWSQAASDSQKLKLPEKKVFWPLCVTTYYLTV